MESYIGVKILQASSMTLGEYNKHRGWEIPKDEDPDKQGYLVVYEDGYQSWSPAEAFEKAYRIVPTGMLSKANEIAEDTIKSAEKLSSVGGSKRKGLVGKKFTDMIGLLELGKTPKEVSEWLSVDVDYVKEHAKTITPKVPPAPDFESLSEDQIIKGEGFTLKQLREYVNAAFAADLPGNSTFQVTVSALLKARSGNQ